jgi:hypothetical protein
MNPISMMVIFVFQIAFLVKAKVLFHTWKIRFLENPNFKEIGHVWECYKFSFYKKRIIFQPSQTKPLNGNAKLLLNQTNQFIKPQIPSLRIIHFVLSFHVTLTLFYHFIFTFIWKNALVRLYFKDGDLSYILLDIFTLLYP